MNQDAVTAVLEPGEKIVWQGIVSRKVIYSSLVLSVIIFGAISLFLFSKNSIDYISNGVPQSISGSIVGSGILIIGILISLLSFFTNFVKNYVITNKRVLIKSGLVGTDFNSIYFTQIRSANVNVGLLDKIFGVGNINIDTGKIETVQSGTGVNEHSNTRSVYDKLVHINNPYEVYKYFETTMSGREESLYSGRADRESQASTL